MKENKEVIETNFNNFNEQLESIKRLEKLVKLRKSKNNIKYDNCICSTEDLENVLKEINIYKKTINLMAENILLFKSEKENPKLPDGITPVKTVQLSTEEVKEYFIRRANDVCKK